LVKELVGILNGTLTYESEPGVGTSFSLQLPVEFCENDLPQYTELVFNQSLPIRLMVVDDDLLNLELIETALGQKLNNIKLFASPDLALENFTAAAFDVVITDYRLPGQNGAELAKIMRGIDPNCSFYLMTAAISDEEAR